MKRIFTFMLGLSLLLPSGNILLAEKKKTPRTLPSYTDVIAGLSAGVAVAVGVEKLQQKGPTIASYLSDVKNSQWWGMGSAGLAASAVYNATESLGDPASSILTIGAGFAGYKLPYFILDKLSELGVWVKNNSMVTSPYVLGGIAGLGVYWYLYNKTPGGMYKKAKKLFENELIHCNIAQLDNYSFEGTDTPMLEQKKELQQVLVKIGPLMRQIEKYLQGKKQNLPKVLRKIHQRNGDLFADIWIDQINHVPISQLAEFTRNQIEQHQENTIDKLQAMYAVLSVYYELINYKIGCMTQTWRSEQQYENQNKHAQAAQDSANARNVQANAVKSGVRLAWLKNMFDVVSQKLGWKSKPQQRPKGFWAKLKYVFSSDSNE